MFLQINMTHYIKHLSFGEDYPGIVNPLDHTNVTAPQGIILGGSALCRQHPAWHPWPVLSPPHSLHDVPVLCEGGAHSVHESGRGGELSTGTGSSWLAGPGSPGVIPPSWGMGCCSQSHLMDAELRPRASDALAGDTGQTLFGLPASRTYCLQTVLGCLLTPVSVLAWGLARPPWACSVSVERCKGLRGKEVSPSVLPAGVFSSLDRQGKRP